MEVIDVTDLLYAHGALCERAYLQFFTDVKEAERLCEVINNFQRALKEHLAPHAVEFCVKCDGYLLVVEPTNGGWGTYHVG